MTKVIDGRFREARLYLVYAASLFRPGMDMPTFSEQSLDGPEVETIDPDELRLILDEARRQLERQQAMLSQVQSRAATLLAIVVAEVALIASSASGVLIHGPAARASAAVAFVAAVLAVGGTGSIIASKSVIGAMDARQLAPIKRDLLAVTVGGYVRLINPGAATVQARVTVLRDAVLLAVVAAVLYAPVYVVVKSAQDDKPGQVTCTACAPLTSMKPSPNSEPTTSASTGSPVPSRRPTPATPRPSLTPSQGR